MKDIEEVIESVRSDLALDRRSSVYEVHHIVRNGVVTLIGHTTEENAIEVLLERVGQLRGVRDVADEVVRLPRGLPARERHAVIRVAVAPLYQDPRIPSPQITQLVLGNRVDLLSRENLWWRIRGEDGYIGWIHAGYLAIVSEEIAQAWERGDHGDPVVSLGAELVDDAQNVFARLPWGARAIRYSHDVYALPNGVRGTLGSGELVPVDRLFDRFPPRGDSVTRTARRWLGAPYLWGGVTMAGVDCSGLSQSVLWMHGIALPRDSDLQARVGSLIDAGNQYDNLAPGDLLFFSENAARITHVAISLGQSKIIHAALNNGEVAINDLNGNLEFEARLRRIYSHSRRVLPD